MDLVTLITLFMLSVGSPTWVVNDYTQTKSGVEVDVQTTTNPAQRYLLLINRQGVQASINIPLDETECQKETST